MTRRFLFSCFLFVLSYTAFAQQQALFDTTYKEYIGKADICYIGTGDINGDGLTDIAAATRPYSDPANDRKIFLWLQGANGQLQTPAKWPYSYNNMARSFAVSDLDNDGTAEILLGLGNYVYIYSWNGSGLITEDSILTISGYTQYGLSTADFDGDGLTDIGVCHWGKQQVTIIYQNIEGVGKWDVRHYNIADNGYGMAIAGKFGTLQQPAFITTIGGAGASYVAAYTFNASRQLQDSFKFVLPDQASPVSYTIVKKGAGKPSELWVTHGGNRPHSQIAVWRGLQSSPDSNFAAYDMPYAIQAANLDCDDDDEPVVFHHAWMRVTVYTNTVDAYPTPYIQNSFREAIALGDVNNDGRIDICVGGGTPMISLNVLYNITPSCWPADVPQTQTTSKELSLYPNPASDYVTVSYTGTGQLLICDVHGRVVHSASFDQKAVVNISPYMPGMYFVKLYSSDGQVYTKKLLKE